MDWINIRQTAYHTGVAFLAIIATTGGIYSAGYPWTCEQAIKARSLADLRLRQAQREYPPSALYRQYREDGKQGADRLVKTKCATTTRELSQNSQTLKFFLKYRSDY